MSEKHLSDDQLQDYLDGNMVTVDSFKAHLESCSQCREALKAYQSLYVMLKEEPPEFLSENFADRTMSRLPEAASQRFALDRLITIIFTGIIAATAIYFLTLSGWLKEASTWSNLFDVIDFRISAISHSHIALLNLDPLMLLFVAITLVSVGLIDHMVAKRRHHQGTISLV